MWTQRMPLSSMMAGSGSTSSGVTGAAGPRRTWRTGSRGVRMAGISIAPLTVAGERGLISGVDPVEHDDYLPEPFKLAEASLHRCNGVSDRLPDRLAVAALESGFGAEVAEWQTRRSQKPLRATSCGFDSHLRHHPREHIREHEHC